MCFLAYFIDGRDLGDEVELNEIAREQGVNIPPEPCRPRPESTNRE